jgi:hypothetical protein
MPKYIGTPPDLTTRDDEGLKKSPYYWWWQYLRNNPDYLETCAAGGRGELAELYADFGDVREEDFRRWWGEDGSNHGRLFEEQSHLQDARLVEGSWDFRDFMGPYPYVVVAVDLRFGLDAAKESIAKAENDRFEKEGRGRPPIEQRYSSARRKLTKDVSQKVYEKGLRIYQLLAPIKGAGRSLTIEDCWQAGIEADLDPALCPRQGEHADDLQFKREAMSAAVRRYFKKAEAMVKVTSTGYFPAPRPASFDEIEDYLRRTGQIS